MQRNRTRIILIQAILGVFILACASATPVASPTATSTPLPPSETPTITLTPTRTVTPTPFYEVKAGKTIKLQSGGFSFQTIEGYTIESHNSGAYLVSDDEMVTIYLDADPPARSITLARLVTDMLDGLSKNFKNLTTGERVKETADGVESIHVDFTSADSRKPMQGGLTVYAPSGGKNLYFLVMAHGDQRWEREGQKVFDQTAASLEFFKIVPLADCPTSRNPDYGATTKRPVKVGGGLADGIQRLRDYLDALLGPKGELVEYYWETSFDENGVTLDKYTLYWGNTWKPLFVDIYNYEELRAPVNMTCSAPFPSEP